MLAAPDSCREVHALKGKRRTLKPRGNISPLEDPRLVPRNYRYTLHPQPTSLRLATLAARKAGLRGEVVLDPFCGTGTCLIAALRAGAREAIGADIEDWSGYLRPELATMLACGSPKVRVLWGLDAREACGRIEHTVLFTDPPNPWDVAGGVPLSSLRKFSIGFTELRRYWSQNIRPENLMGKGKTCVLYLIRLVRAEFERGVRVVMNLLRSWGNIIRSKRDKHDLARAFAGVFRLRPLGVGYWHEVTGVR